MNNTKSILKQILLPWQQKWVADNSRFKIGMWSRQTGKSFSTACEAVTACAAQERNSSELWVVLSAGERQALEWMEKAKKWAKAIKATVDSYDELRASADALISRAEIRFANGARIVAIPANPDTARGYSGNLILDEFAIHEKPFDIWAAIYPSITNPLTGEKKLRIVSTPKGRGNKFADLWEHNKSYSKHKVTIEDAVRLGLPINLEELKNGVDDPDIWAQEYMCEFIDNSSVLLPYDLIGKCESSHLQDDGSSPLFIGMDIGRQKDLSVIITGVKLGDVLSIISVEVLRKMPFADQLDIIVHKASNSRVQRVCIDSTGIGAMLAEEATRKAGAKVRGVTFTASSKGEMYSLMRRRFEERSIRVPIDRELREDLHAVQRIVSTGGNISYAAPRSTDGHSDRASALALCSYAAKSNGVKVPPFTFNSNYSSELT
ncbi:MAG: terminase family protein [Kiritimatiellae bacterium]|nr:terminase family protein [Kiritimatiellia bacterium]